jgi:hypothetical protein
MAVAPPVQASELAVAEADALIFTKNDPSPPITNPCVLDACKAAVANFTVEVDPARANALPTHCPSSAEPAFTPKVIVALP